MKNLKIILLIVALALCAGVIPVWPFVFYYFLRVAVFVAAGYAFYLLKEDEAFKTHMIILAVVAILFNPIIPIALPMAMWQFINLGCAVYFLQLSKKIQS